MSVTLLVIDEIHKVSGWPETLKMLYEPIGLSKRLHVVLLNLASLSIQHGLSALRARRFELIKVSHWDYTEAMQGVAERARFERCQR